MFTISTNQSNPAKPRTSVANRVRRADQQPICTCFAASAALNLFGKHRYSSLIPLLISAISIRLMSPTTKRWQTIAISAEHPTKTSAALKECSSLTGANQSPVGDNGAALPKTLKTPPQRITISFGAVSKSLASPAHQILCQSQRHQH